MATNLTIVDVFEEVLQIPFEPAYSVDLAADVFLVRKLAHRLEDYYQSFEIPLKADNELRPYLYQGYIDGSIFWDSFVRFEGSTYTVSSSAPSMEAMIKPYLLYSHSVCIPDPLPGLLDYFRRNTGSASSLETARLPGVINLLQQYARTSKLIRHRILIPFSFEDTFGRVSSNHFWPTAAERAEIKRSLLNNNDHASGDSAGDLKILMAEKIKEQLWITHRSGGRLDLYFPTSHYVPLLRSLLRSAQQPYASADIRLPFHAGFLGGVSNLDSSKVSIEDIMLVRNEEVFEHFRAFLRHAFDQIHQREGEFSDEQTEFSRAIRDELTENDAKIREMTRKSSVLANVFSNTDRILFGALTGSIGGILSGSPTLAVAGAAIGGAIRPTYDIVRQLLTTPASTVAARASLRNHFVALGIKDTRA